jgi:hypothetical protein
MYLASIQDVRTVLDEYQTREAIQSILLFCADREAPSTQELEDVLAFNKKALIGGIVPEVISEGTRFEKGFLLMGLSNELDTFVFEDKDSIHSFIDEVKDVQAKNESDYFTLFTFVDAFWLKKKYFLSKLYDHLGPFVNYLGGGAGSLSFQSKPCIFHNQKVYHNAAVLALMKKQTAIGVAHGWKSISDPIKVTETQGNEIISLNWKPAFEVYQQLIYSHSQQTITEDNFFEIAKSYPLGLVRFGDEMIIRDPYATLGGNLKIVDEVPFGEYIRIMNGDMESLLSGARKAFVDSSKFDFTDEIEKFCVDCISRVLFMNKDFNKELLILNQSKPANGILSIGEIANPGNSTLEIFNKTVVVAQWKKTS